MIVPYQHRGPGTNYNAFGELRGPARTQDQIRAYLAEGEAIAARQREATLAAVAPGAGEVAMSTQELHGAGPAAAEQVAATPALEVAAPEVVSAVLPDEPVEQIAYQLRTAMQNEVA